MQNFPLCTSEGILNGKSLQGKRVLITGVSSGMGVETARVLAEHGAEVVGTARDIAKADSALAAAGCAPGVELVTLDLESMASVRRSAEAVLAADRPLDAIIANAGVMGIPFKRTADGFEAQFATNYLGHYLLITSLAASMHTGSRVVLVSSAGHRGADIDLDDPNFERQTYDPLTAYRRSKTAMILFAVAFDGRHRRRGLRATAVHPGAVLTETTRTLIDEQPDAALRFTWKNVREGAATALWAGFVAPADEVGGRYCEDCHVAAVNDDSEARSGVRSYAIDPVRAEALWSSSARMVGYATDHPQS